jgi:2-dehydropantoate 2-reductase
VAKVTIIGAGAIGGLAGAWMTMAGEDVTLVDRWDEHVRAMQRDGLFIDGLRGEHRVQVRAATVQELRGPLELVFLACKSHDTHAAVKEISDLLDDRSTVVSLQNGMNEELIGELIGVERVLGAIPDYGGALVGPGHIEFVHPGEAYVGELDGSITERAREAQRLLCHLVDTELTTNIVGRIWAKQVHMSQVVMTALVDTPIADVLHDERARHLGVSLIAEAIAVADAAGVNLPDGKTVQTARYRARQPNETRVLIAELGDWVDTLHQHQREQEQQGTHRYVKKASGMWWDIYYRHRPSETRGITGALIGRAAALNVAVPLNERTATMIYELEEGRRDPGFQNIEELYEFGRNGHFLLPL